MEALDLVPAVAAGARVVAKPRVEYRRCSVGTTRTMARDGVAAMGNGECACCDRVARPAPPDSVWLLWPGCVRYYLVLVVSASAPQRRRRRRRSGATAARGKAKLRLVRCPRQG